MKIIALTKAGQRLEESYGLLPGLRPTDVQGTMQFNQYWSAYLTSINSIFEILRAGTGQNELSKSWARESWSRIENDPLIYYLRCARNVDYHGLDRAAHALLGTNEIMGFPEITVHISSEPGGPSVPQRMRAIHIGGDQPLDRAMELKIELLTVPGLGRDKSMIGPPTVHLRQQVVDRTPYGVANLACIFYGKLLNEARSLTR